VDEPTTLWVASEGVSIPLLCASKVEALRFGQEMDAVHITSCDSVWAPCCLDPSANAACIRDHFGDDEDEDARSIFTEAAHRAGLTVPVDLGAPPESDD
jgi:hypothetical protein